MRVIVPTLVGLAAFSAVSAQAAPNPSNWYETPAQNVWRSQQYDYLLRTDTNFRVYRIKKECGPITDPALRGNCILSFSAYEPMRRQYSN
jgi:hypothetical protein